VNITVRGESFEVRPESWDFWGLVDRGTWEPETFAVLEKYLSPDKDCLDLGAWAGPVTLYASRKARTVFAVEPDPGALLSLLANLGLNNVSHDKVVVLQAALGSADEWRSFGAPQFLGDSKAGVGVNPMFYAPTVSFSTLLRMVPIRDLGFLKMDIEGGEEFALPAMARWLAFFKPTMLVSFHPKAYTHPAASTLLSGCLKPYTYLYHPDGTPMDVARVSEKIWAGDNFTVLATETAWT
jgi:FkbM family methyltransferase